MSLRTHFIVWTLLGFIVPFAVYVWYISTDDGVKFLISGNKNENSTNLFYNPTLFYQKQRRFKMATTCRHYKLAEDEESSSKSYLIVNDKYRTIYCFVPKVGCTNWKRVFLYLNGYRNVSDPLDLSLSEAHTNTNLRLSFLSQYSAADVKYRLKNYFKFTVVREPLERVLSAYRNKFQSQYSTYFHKRFGRAIVKRYRTRKRSNESVGNDVTFIEFIRYLLDPRTTRVKPFNEHWIQQYKICRPCNIKYDYIARYETIDQDAEYILRRMGVNDSVKFPERMYNYRYNATSNFLSSYYSKIPTRMLKDLYNKYRIDYELYDYEFPRFIAS